MNDSLPDVWTSTVTMLMELDTDEDPQDSIFVADYHGLGHVDDEEADVLFLLDDDDDDMSLTSPVSFESATPYSPLRRNDLHASACISPDSMLTDDSDERLLLSSLPPVMPPPPLFVSSLADDDESDKSTTTSRMTPNTHSCDSPQQPCYQAAAQKLMQRMQKTDETRKQIGEQVFLNIQLTARQELYWQLTAAAKMA